MPKENEVNTEEKTGNEENQGNEQNQNQENQQANENQENNENNAGAANENLNAEDIVAKHERGEKLTEAEEEVIARYDADLTGESPAENKGESTESSQAGEKTEQQDGAGGSKAKTSESTPNKGSQANEENEPSPERKAEIEKEAEKPIGQEDLSKYTKNERGIFRELRKTRIRAQRAEQGERSALFTNLKTEIGKTYNLKPADQQDGGEGGKAAKAGESKEGDLNIDEINDDDMVDGKTLKSFLGKIEGIVSKAVTGAVKPIEQSSKEQYLNDVQSKARAVYTDWDDVCKFAYLIEKDEDTQFELAECQKNGGNPAKLMYEILMEFDEVKTKFGGTTQQNERANRMKKNNEKIKTGGGQGGAAGAGDAEYTEGELLNMSADDFSKLPVAKQDEILKKYG